MLRPRGTLACRKQRRSEVRPWRRAANSVWMTLMQQTLLPFRYVPSGPVAESKGVVYTKSWVVDLLLDLAGYGDPTNLVDVLAIDPAAGEGAFLVAMARRLAASCGGAR